MNILSLLGVSGWDDMTFSRTPIRWPMIHQDNLFTSLEATFKCSRKTWTADFGWRDGVCRRWTRTTEEHKNFPGDTLDPNSEHNVSMLVLHTLSREGRVDEWLWKRFSWGKQYKDAILEEEGGCDSKCSVSGKAFVFRWLRIVGVTGWITIELREGIELTIVYFENVSWRDSHQLPPVPVTATETTPRPSLQVDSMNCGPAVARFAG